jgi:hypothetical protein
MRSTGIWAICLIGLLVLSLTAMPALTAAKTATPTAKWYGIAGMVYSDVNGNGRKDSGDAGLAAVPVYAYLSGKKTPYTTRTDRYGAYSFNSLPAGTYTVQVITPSGYLATTAKSGTTKLPGVTQYVLNFGLAKPVTITGYCFFDRNQNRKWNSGEPGEYGVPVVLSGPGNLVKAASTNKNGFFTFAGLAPGVYTVEAGNPDFPCTTADHVAVTLLSGQTVNLYSKYGLFGVFEHGP